ncbi:kinase domain protein (macronuclear) [Tetrahymena thermophila SB210]|uniref:Kinase domain protein n=1 Tax=Tetrahymena thermophila (strain SB210) TaxID=312017 RepID=Q22B97_TETTS|nr:kinase domain protein [Tetrahymena thermophila SB210]EAR82556.2 kinase domain protein [Tetrahymena thermophila SB210]|eukprot:XP_001030219.2 kinase domain protein [Tetrahymena thermophila SB210]
MKKIYNFFIRTQLIALISKLLQFCSYKLKSKTKDQKIQDNNQLNAEIFQIQLFNLDKTKKQDLKESQIYFLVQCIALSFQLLTLNSMEKIFAMKICQIYFHIQENVIIFKFQMLNLASVKSQQEDQNAQALAQKIVLISQISNQTSMKTRQMMKVFRLYLQLQQIVLKFQLYVQICGNFFLNKQISFNCKIGYLNHNKSCTNIGTVGAQSLGLNLAKCMKLSTLILFLYFNNIDDKGVSLLSSGLSKCKVLSNLTLGLSNNSIGDQGVKDLGFSFQNYDNLQSLNLSLDRNNFGQIGVSGLAIIFQNCTKLNTLALNFSYNNDIGAQGFQILCQGLAKNKNLSSLVLILCKTQLGDQSLQELGSALVKCSNLSIIRLDLFGNKIGNQGALNLGLELSRCAQLSHLTLDLSQNLVQGQGAINLGSNLKKCVNLKTLKLDILMCQIENDQQKKMIFQICKIKRLVEKNINQLII